MTAYDGMGELALARRLNVPRVAVFDTVDSTMDSAHALAEEGTPAGTLVLANAQSAGRGRDGKSWRSAAGAGIWMTLIERPADSAAVEVLSLRMGLCAAAALDHFTSSSIQVKWPNDLMLPTGKLAGILVEARWRAQTPQWVAIGIGINMLAPPEGVGGAALGEEVWRTDVLQGLIPALRAAARSTGSLDSDELRAFTERDWARGRRAITPHAGTVAGLSPNGALLIRTLEGTMACASGSLVLDGVTP